jgi:predicted metal-dependent peptidase
MEKLTPVEAFQAARLRLVRERPYLASAAYRIRGPIVAELPEPTMAVDDRWRLYIDPRVLDRWNAAEMAGVVEHEVWHLALGHPHRGRARGITAGSPEHLAWQLAVDAVVNAMVGGTLPPGGVTAEGLGLPEGLTADEYYDLLLQRQDGGGGGDADNPFSTPGSGSCADGIARPWEQAGDSGEDGDGAPVPGEAETELIARGIAREIAQKGCGNVPAGLQRWAEVTLAPPQVPWQSVLAAALRDAVASATGMVDYTFRRPSRRQGDVRIVLPSMRAPRPDVAVVVDTSASMSEADLAAALIEVSGVLRAAGCSIALLACDTEPTVQRIVAARQARFIGGGGTDMGAGLRAAARLRPRPNVTVVLTDGETPWPVTKPACGRVIVALVSATPQQVAARVPGWARIVEVTP